ncbi:MAG: Secretion system C-terminal sorting domain [Bacteroidota bacterium]|jgi:hypothetical protein
MKNILFIITLLMYGLQVRGQSSSLFIDSLKISPNIPEIDDTIQFVAYTRHATTGSGKYDRKVFITDTTINIYSCWTRGPFQSVEYVNDTFKLNPMPIGNYRIRFLYKSLLPWELDSIEPCLTNPYYDSAFLAFTVYAPNAINNLDDEKVIGLYPNPAYNSLYIHLLESPAESVYYDITNPHGQILSQSVITGCNFTIDVSTLPPGLYFLQLTNGRQRSIRKFVKQ